MKDPARNFLVELKKAAGRPGPPLSLPVGNPVQALLRPVATQAQYLDPEDVKVLTQWRNRFVRSFLTEFEATETRTARWLVETVGPSDSRILFMAQDVGGRVFGYMGLAFIDWDRRSGEADAIVRGGDAPPGTMSLALRVLLDWSRGQLGLERMGVRVLSDNPAVEFYRKAGFRETKRVALRRIEKHGEILWEECESGPSGGRTLVHMTLG